jgi:hypothetical protein
MEDTAMKKAIKRGQNQACLSYAERELFGATLKKKYMKPSFRVVELRSRAQILTESEDPKRNAPWWDGEAGARRRGNDVWDDEDGWEDE